MTNVTYVRQSSMATFTFFTSDYLRYLRKKQSVIHLPTPLENAPTVKLVKYQTFFYLTEGLHCTCLFRTCVFQYLRFQRPRIVNCLKKICYEICADQRGTHYQSRFVQYVHTTHGSGEAAYR